MIFFMHLNFHILTFTTQSSFFFFLTQGHKEDREREY